jgi:hypothetical protein
MRNVEWKSRQGPVCHTIYERPEADELGIKYTTNLRADPEPGRWILTDDGKVIQILNMGLLRDGARWIRTATGTFAIDDKNTVVDTKDRGSRYTLGGTARPISHQRPAPEWTQFGVLVASGMPPETAYRMVYPEATKPAYIREKTTLLLQKKEVRLIMSQKVEEVLKALNIDATFLLQRYRELAINADSDAVCIQALNSLSRIAGIIEPAGGKQVRGAPVFVGLSQEQLRMVEDAYTRPIVGEVVSELPELPGLDDESLGDTEDADCIDAG